MVWNSDDEDVGEFGSFFNEPEGFRPPPKPETFSEHTLRSGQVLRVRLVGSHPLYVCLDMSCCLGTVYMEWKGHVMRMTWMLCLLFDSSLTVSRDIYYGMQAAQ